MQGELYHLFDTQYGRSPIYIVVIVQVKLNPLFAADIYQKSFQLYKPKFNVLRWFWHTLIGAYICVYRSCTLLYSNARKLYKIIKINGYMKSKLWWRGFNIASYSRNFAIVFIASSVLRPIKKFVCHHFFQKRGGHLVSFCLPDNFLDISDFWSFIFSFQSRFCTWVAKVWCFGTKLTWNDNLNCICVLKIIILKIHAYAMQTA